MLQSGTFDYFQRAQSLLYLEITNRYYMYLIDAGNAYHLGKQGNWIL